MASRCITAGVPAASTARCCESITEAEHDAERSEPRPSMVIGWLAGTEVSAAIWLARRYSMAPAVGFYFKRIRQSCCPLATWSAAVGPVAYGLLVAVELQKPGRRQTRRKVRDTVFMYSNSRLCPQSPPSTHLSPPPPPGRGRACSRCDHASPGRCGGQPNWSTGRAGPSSLPLRHWAGTGRRARAESGWPARPTASDRGG